MSDKRPLSLAICIVTPLVILAIGGTAAVAMVLKDLPSLKEKSGRAVVPPALEAKIDAPGTYTVWFHTYTTFEGKVYSVEQERLPSGTKVMVTEKESGKVLPLTIGLSSSKSFGSDKAIGVGTFQSGKTGEVLVTVSGLPRPQVFSVAPIKVAAVFRLVVSVVLIISVAFVMAVIVLIVLLKRRNQHVPLH